MTTETTLPELVGTLAALPEHTQKTIQAYGAACAITALQSEQVQAWKEDAELFQFLLEEAWFHRAFDRFDPDDGGKQSKFELECRRILSAAMGQQT